MQNGDVICCTFRSVSIMYIKNLTLKCFGVSKVEIIRESAQNSNFMVEMCL